MVGRGAGGGGVGEGEDLGGGKGWWHLRCYSPWSIAHSLRLVPSVIGPRSGPLPCEDRRARWRGCPRGTVSPPVRRDQPRRSTSTSRCPSPRPSSHVRARCQQRSEFGQEWETEHIPCRRAKLVRTASIVRGRKWVGDTIHPLPSHT